MSDADRGDEDRHKIVAATGNAAAGLMDALQEDEIVEALEAIVGWAGTLQRRLAPFDVSSEVAIGWVLGVVLAAMNAEQS